MKLKPPIILSIALLMAILTGCQQNPNKPTEFSEDEKVVWSQLQQTTLSALKQKNFGQAFQLINTMIGMATKNQDQWEYIRMAIVTMPEDLAQPLIDKSLDHGFVKENGDELFGFSRVLTQLKQHDKAIKLINQAIKKDKKAEYVYWRARLYLLAEEESLAEKDYLWLIEQDQNNSDYINQYATLLSYLKRNDEAIKLLNSKPDDPSLLFRQIVLLIQQEQDEQAEIKFNELKDSISEKTLDPQQYLEIGELAYWLEDYETSMTLLQQVVSGEGLSEARLLMARVLVEKENYDRASIMFEQVQNGPEEYAIPAYLYEIEMFREKQQVSQAIDVANSGLKMFLRNPDLLYSRAMLYEIIDNINALEKDLMVIIDNDPDNAQALNALGYTWADRDMNLDQAYEYIMKAHAIKPKDQAILDSVGWIYYKKGDFDKAEKYLRLATGEHYRDKESFQHLITVLKAQGKLSEASELEEKMREHFPDS